MCKIFLLFDKHQTTPVSYQPPPPPLPPPMPNRPVSNYEDSWRSKFPRVPTMILGGVQVVLIGLIFILEIAALAIASYRNTGAGIWCSIVFLPTAVLTFLLGRRFIPIDKYSCFFLSPSSLSMGTSTILGDSCAHCSIDFNRLLFHSHWYRWKLRFSW